MITEDGVTTSENSAPVPASNTRVEHAHLLTDEEHSFMELTGQLWKALCGLTGKERTRPEDLHEAAAHIHALQTMVLAQAAARAYPDRYRLLGGTIIATSDTSPLCGWCAAMPGELHRIPCPKARP